MSNTDSMCPIVAVRVFPTAISNAMHSHLKRHQQNRIIYEYSSPTNIQSPSRRLAYGVAHRRPRSETYLLPVTANTTPLRVRCCHVFGKISGRLSVIILRLPFFELEGVCCFEFRTPTACYPGTRRLRQSRHTARYEYICTHDLAPKARTSACIQGIHSSFVIRIMLFFSTSHHSATPIFCPQTQDDLFQQAAHLYFSCCLRSCSLVAAHLSA